MDVFKMKEINFVLTVLFIITSVFIGDSYSKATLDICKRTPIHTTAAVTGGDNGFEIKISDLPASGKYVPGETYTEENAIKINNSRLLKYTSRCVSTLDIIEIQDSEKNEDNVKWMLGFMLVAVKQGTKDERDASGSFIIPPDRRVQKAPDCDHTVITHHYLMFKKGMMVQWQAPPRAPPNGTKCTEFRASVIELPDVWYKDEGKLTKIICEEEVSPAPQGDESAPVEENGCCACGSARYKMHFQGKWTRQRHPKDFPTTIERTVLLHWSSIIGSSHNKDYKIWEYGKYASRAVKEVCEYGFSNFLEQEMKKNIRSFRSAMFDVDQDKHLLSLLTMIGPSPDWCVVN
ncbi:hypothetical protein KUTeg_006690 [Tegillarca granosa]|uniref:Uncharacterized protein n=1 Tax=Tegillarca granosa TaxID=220873 RepID=A0ABQ9FB20_TEGGR|nr:hypothetical protein KUTeg_006690 [Tegillarca granosa]